MKLTKIFLAALLAGIVALGGCSRPASDNPSDNQDPAPEVQTSDEEQDTSTEDTTSPSEPEEESPDTTEDTEEEESDEETSDENQEEEESGDAAFNPDDLESNATQGCYKIFDSGFEVTVQQPFVVYYDPLAYNMTATIPDNPACRIFIFYDSSDQSMVQLEDSVKVLEDSIKADPTVSDLKTEVEEQDDGLFSFTFTYSAGATEGSPAGFYFVHYQKAQQGVISVNCYTDRSSNSEDIMKLINSIQLVTENAVEYQS